MNEIQVYALGRDVHWLKAVAGAAHGTVHVQTIALEREGLPHSDRLPAAVPGALLLLDATHQPQVKAAVKWLDQQGWGHIVIVAADPNWKEAYALIKEGAAYDYWTKSYEVDVIRHRISACLQEMRELATLQFPQKPRPGAD